MADWLPELPMTARLSPGFSPQLLLYGEQGASPQLGLNATTLLGKSTVAFSPRETSPHVNRLRLSWISMRERILDMFPAPPAVPTDARAYLKRALLHGTPRLRAQAGFALLSLPPEKSLDS